MVESSESEKLAENMDSMMDYDQILDYIGDIDQELVSHVSDDLRHLELKIEHNQRIHYLQILFTKKPTVVAQLPFQVHSNIT